jgi:hypothetical protein
MPLLGSKDRFEATTQVERQTCRKIESDFNGRQTMVVVGSLAFVAFAIVNLILFVVLLKGLTRMSK